MATSYKKFQKINGSHPWRGVSPEGYVDYPARYRDGGRVIYFNFDLAKDMGLISKKHAHRLNQKLEKAILQTFSLQIINEHDQQHNPEMMAGRIPGYLFMASRYLQMQHSSKQGRTSGDGRSIWNGCITTRTMTYDISSRGTGATILSPGAQETDEPIQTGDETHGYASGLADLDEMLAGAVVSEIFFREGVPTERCLAVIDYQDKSAIGVRTAPNLIRPAHLFRYLKSGSWNELKNSFDYFLRRQKKNGMLGFSLRGKARYHKALDYLADLYARLVAVMEEEYIFNWLAWDGDNMLASGALLDYGSIRQFAAKHDRYRYEDVDGYSTCLSEQRIEARYLVQTFAQAVDFIVTTTKKTHKEFEQHSSLEIFDRIFILEKQKRVLRRLGFDVEQINIVRKNHQDTVQAFRKVLNYFEEAKTGKGERKVPDGIDHPPIFLIRRILRELPAFLLKNRNEQGWQFMTAEDFCQAMAASYAQRKDLVLNDYRRRQAHEFQRLYLELVHGAGPDAEKTMQYLAERSAVINYAYRSTGDGLVWIVDEAIRARGKMKQNEFQQAIDRFIESQVLVPGIWKPIRPEELKGSSTQARLLRRVQKNLEQYDENI